ncbi:MAG: enoyl-CoA hydratase/isomerase family protein [Bacteroidetes bacterium]|nr:enoyl-CoA hydratase/isomerase family protein [Bacteroidota bacterium]
MPATFTGKKISWEVRDEIGYLSLVDPPENRMDSAFFEEFGVVVNEIIPASAAIALIISGTERHFSSGAELEDLFRIIKQEKSDVLISNFEMFHAVDQLKIPVIAAIKGVCIGSGLELALHCHFRLCSEDAILGLPESSFGLIPGLGGISKLMEFSGKAKAIELVLKGSHFNATDALKWQIVDEVYPKKIVVEKAAQLAKLCVGDYRKYNKRDYLKRLKIEA